MKRYIDAELAKETIREYLKTEAPMPIICKKVMDIAIGAVDLTPTADAVEVVRCKDCKHYCLSDFRKPNEPRWCELINDGYFYPKEDFYCGFGERREKCGIG